MGYEERRLLYLPIRLLQPGPGARSRHTVALQELSASIRQVGILQPLTVCRSGGQYIVVSGNRRLMAAKMAELGEVPCILTELGERDQALIALTENLQREDLHYFEEAELLRQYMQRSGLSQAQAARRLLPQAINLATRMIKTTSLVMLIGVVEVLKVGSQIIDAARYDAPQGAVWVYAAVFFLYFIACWPISLIAGKLERKWS